MNNDNLIDNWSFPVPPSNEYNSLVAVYWDDGTESPEVNLEFYNDNTGAYAFDDETLPLLDVSWPWVEGFKPCYSDWLNIGIEPHNVSDSWFTVPINRYTNILSKAIWFHKREIEILSRKPIGLDIGYCEGVLGIDYTKYPSLGSNEIELIEHLGLAKVTSVRGNMTIVYKELFSYFEDIPGSLFVYEDEVEWEFINLGVFNENAEELSDDEKGLLAPDVFSSVDYSKYVYYLKEEE